MGQEGHSEPLFFSEFFAVWPWGSRPGQGAGVLTPAGCGGLSREPFVAFLNSETENRPSWRGTIPCLGFAHTIVEVPLAENGPPRPIWPTVWRRSGNATFEPDNIIEL